MNTYRITEADGRYVATVPASTHRDAALRISCALSVDEVRPVDQPTGTPFDDALGAHLVVEGRELIVTDVEHLPGDVLAPETTTRQVWAVFYRGRLNGDGERTTIEEAQQYIRQGISLGNDPDDYEVRTRTITTSTTPWAVA